MNRDRVILSVIFQLVSMAYKVLLIFANIIEKGLFVKLFAIRSIFIRPFSIATFDHNIVLVIDCVTPY